MIKAMSDAPDYKLATGSKLCANCVHYDKGNCDLFDFKASPRYTCSAWEGGDRKEVSSTPTGVMGHGPGGTFSVAGLEESVKEFAPPTAVRNAAKRGLALRRQYGRGGLTNAEASEQGIGSGVQRAVNLANGNNLSLDTIKRMVAFFARHEKNKNTPPEEGNGKISWLLWGGDAGRAWAEGIVRREEAKREKAYQDRDGIMVAFAPSRDEAQKLAQNWGDAERWEELHLTLCYMPSAANLAAYKAKLLGAVNDFAKTQRPITGKINGHGRFVGVGDNGTDAVWAHWDSAELPAFRQALIEQIVDSGVPYEPSHGFTSHITLAYTDKARVPELPINMPITFDSVRLHWGDDVVSFPLKGESSMTTAKEFIRQKAMKITKTEDGVSYPATAYLVVEDNSKPTTWHLRYRNEDGEIDNRLLGAAQAALTVGYRGNKYQGPQKGEALAKLRKLREQAGLTTKPSTKRPDVYDALRKRGMEKGRAAAISNALAKTNPSPRTKETSFAVYKNKKGEYRWVSLSSNAYRDRDGEIVSEKALSADVERADKTKDYGPLRFWHMPGVDIGDADFNAMHGRFLVESGTFRDPRIAEAVAKKAADYQLSIGFRHPTDNPDKDGVFHNIRRFERSLVPAGRAANPFTSLSVKESYMDKQKVQALKALLEDDDFVADILQSADTSQKAADGMGIAFKEYEEFPDLYEMTSDQLLDFALAMKEAEATIEDDDEEEDDAIEIEIPTKSKKQTEKPEKELPFELKMGGLFDDMSKKMDGYSKKMDEMYKMLQQHTSMHGEGKKDYDEYLDIADAQTLRIAELEESIKAMQDQFAEATKELKALKGNAPRGVTGYRPTQDAANVTDDDPAVQVAHKNGQATAADGFFDFVIGGNQ